MSEKSIDKIMYINDLKYNTITLSLAVPQNVVKNVK